MIFFKQIIRKNVQNLKKYTRKFKNKHTFIKKIKNIVYSSKTPL